MGTRFPKGKGYFLEENVAVHCKVMRHSTVRCATDEIFKIRMAICNPFRNVLATNNDEWSDFANFDRKIGCHGNVH